jgi:hypothetical protein
MVLALVSACADQPPPSHSQAAPPPASRPAPEPQAPAETSRPSPREETNRRVVDLQRDERSGGHTIARHVGRTDAQLKARLARESIAAASTYVDLETAERVVARALAENERRVQRWIDRRGPRSNLAVRYRARDGIPTGRILRRGDDESRDALGAVVVLRWRDEGYYVLTSYPEDPR